MPLQRSLALCIFSVAISWLPVPASAAILTIEGYFTANYTTDIESLSGSFTATLKEGIAINSSQTSQVIPLTFTSLELIPSILGETPLTPATVGADANFVGGEFVSVILGIMNQGATQRGIGSVTSNTDDFYVTINANGDFNGNGDLPLSSVASVATSPMTIGGLEGTGEGRVSITPEPGSLVMLGFAALGLLRIRRRC